MTMSVSPSILTLLYKLNEINEFREFSGYSTLEKIGEGNFSEVNKILDKCSRRCYAAKVLKERFKSIEEAMCCTEIIALRTLQQHPNVAGITDFLYDPNTQQLTIITELAHMNLYEYIKDRKRCLSENRCKHFLFQLVSGLKYLHSRQIFHRDIKPENCLIKLNKRLGTNPIQAEILQLADFGMVCSFDQKPPLASYISTRWYRAPEVILTNGYYGPPIDIWALGCIFYEILTLKPLFPGENQVDQLNKIHSVLGSPSKDLLKRFKFLTDDIPIHVKKGTHLHTLLPNLSDDGMDILRKSLEYRYDLRINAFQMFEHSYFDSLRQSTSRLSNDSSEGINRTTNTCLAQKLQKSETKLKERLWGMNSVTHMFCKPRQLTHKSCCEVMDIANRACEVNASMVNEFSATYYSYLSNEHLLQKCFTLRLQNLC